MRYRAKLPKSFYLFSLSLSLTPSADWPTCCRLHQLYTNCREHDSHTFARLMDGTSLSRFIFRIKLGLRECFPLKLFSLEISARCRCLARTLQSGSKNCTDLPNFVEILTSSTFVILGRYVELHSTKFRITIINCHVKKKKRKREQKLSTRNCAPIYRSRNTEVWRGGPLNDVPTVPFHTMAFRANFEHRFPHSLPAAVHLILRTHDLSR